MVLKGNLKDNYVVVIFARGGVPYKRHAIRVDLGLGVSGVSLWLRTYPEVRPTPRSMLWITDVSPAQSFLQLTIIGYSTLMLHLLPQNLRCHKRGILGEGRVRSFYKLFLEAAAPAIDAFLGCILPLQTPLDPVKYFAPVRKFGATWPRELMTAPGQTTRVLASQEKMKTIARLPEGFQVSQNTLDFEDL